MASSRVIALAPYRSEGYILKALWQRKQGDLAGALESLDRASEWRGEEVDSLMFKGMVLRELGREQEALETFASVVAEDPSNEVARQAMEATVVTSVPESTDDPQ